MVLLDIIKNYLVSPAKSKLTTWRGSEMLQVVWPR